MREEVESGGENRSRTLAMLRFLKIEREIKRECESEIEKKTKRGRRLK